MWLSHINTHSLGIFEAKEFASAMYLKSRMEDLCVCQVFLSWDELHACLGLEIDHHPIWKKGDEWKKAGFFYF